MRATLDPLTPDLQDAERIRAAAGSGPVVMLNLLKFKTDGGREAFGNYGSVTGPILAKAGGRMVYSGEGGPVLAGAEDWDMVALVRFDDIDRFMELLTDPLYQSEGRRHREAALERTLWMVTHPHGE
jgi:uncharacterized protein (DUF1330 family)